MVRETMALRATEEPRLMSAMTIPKPRDTQRALRGMFQPGFTRRRLREKGNPSSRAKAQIWRDAVATSLTTAEIRVIIIMAAMMAVPALLWVMSEKSWRKGKPVGLER